MDVVLLPINSSESIKLALVYDAGFSAHTSASAGLFKTLEYILFRGPATSPGEPEPAGALAALAPLEIQGGASSEGFSLSLLLNPSMLREGLDTIAYLFSHLRIQSALADNLALSNAKESVMGMINHSLSDPFSIYDAAISKKLFSASPWRFDEAGADYLVRPATAASLQNLATAWLVPNNAALVIAGEFDPSLAKQWIQAAFSDWKRSPDPWKSSAYPVLPKPGISRPLLMVYPDPSMIDGEAVIEMRYRGPDAGSPRAPALELLAAMASKPQSKLVAAVSSGLPSWANPREFSIRYRQSRATSWFSASAKISTSPKGNLPEAVLSFKETVRGAQMYAMKSNPSYFTPAEYTLGKNELLQAKQSALSEPRLAADFIAKAWLRGRSPYLLAWEDKIKALGTKDITTLADEFFMKNLEVVAVRVSLDDYAQREKSFKSYGFETINAKTAFWWR
jgi:predicted Zn-dependent peptidase